MKKSLLKKRVGILAATAIVCSILLNSSYGSVPSPKSSKTKETPKKEEVLTTTPIDYSIPVAGGYSNPITYYNQSDPAWATFLYGGKDPMAVYGCGPAALAIAVASLTKNKVNPIDTAVWASDNGYYSYGHGSAHNLIPDGAKAYGLKVELLAGLTPESIRTALTFRKLIVFLMGPGDFSDSGHFIVAYGYEADGSIKIADPASEKRSSRTWPAEVLLSQTADNAKGGGPIWVLSSP